MNLAKMMKEAQAMQKRLEDMQAKAAETVMEGQAGGGMVTVALDGKNAMRKISIDKGLLVPDDVEVLEDLIVAAFNDARTKVERYMAEEGQKVTAGLPLPPGMKLPF